MDRELAEFFIQFTAKGFSEVSDKIDSLSKKMDDLGDASEKAAEKHESFFGKIGNGKSGWIGSLLSLTAVVWGLRTAWNAVADAAASTMTIYNQAMLAGTDPQTLERWQNVARHKGLNANEIFSDFRAGQDLLKSLEYAEISADFNKVFALNDLEFAALEESVMKGNLNDTFAMLNKKLSAKGADGNFLIDSADADRIMKQLGFGDTMLSLLREKGLPTELQNAKLIYTRDPEILKASARRTEARETLRDTVNTIASSPELISAQTAILTTLNQTLERLEPHIENIATWAAKQVERITKATEAIFTNEGDTDSEKMAGKTLKVLGGGAALVGLGAAGAPALPAILTAGVAAWGLDKLHNYLLQFDWYKKFVNTGVAPEGFWENYNVQYQEMLKGADAGNVQPFYAGMTLPKNDSNATAVINLNGVTRAEKRGNGWTEITLSVDDVVEDTK